MSIETTPPGKEEVIPSTPNPTPPGKKFSRRKIIALAGTGTFVLVAGGGVWRAEDQGVFSTGQGPAYELLVKGGHRVGTPKSGHLSRSPGVAV